MRRPQVATRVPCQRSHNVITPRSLVPPPRPPAFPSRTGAKTQNDTVLLAIRGMVTLFPAIILLAAMFIFNFYTLDEPTHDEVMEGLNEFHEGRVPTDPFTKQKVVRETLLARAASNNDRGKLVSRGWVACRQPLVGPWHVCARASAQADAPWRDELTCTRWCFVWLCACEWAQDKDEREDITTYLLYFTPKYVAFTRSVAEPWR